MVEVIETAQSETATPSEVQQFAELVGRAEYFRMRLSFIGMYNATIAFVDTKSAKVTALFKDAGKALSIPDDGDTRYGRTLLYSAELQKTLEAFGQEPFEKKVGADHFLVFDDEGVHQVPF